MNAIWENALVEAGLSRNESRVYLALLRLSTATAVEITRESRVHRVNVYDALERLREKGLVSSIIVGKKHIYEAANPNQLLSLIKKKEELVNEVLPALKEEYGVKKDKQEVHFFLGPDGIMQAYYMMLDQRSIIYAMGGSGMTRRYLAHRHVMWNKERIRRGIKGKVIYYEFTRNTKRSWDEDKTMEVRYIDNKYRTPGMVDICGNLIVNLLPVEDSVMAIVIENKHLADTYRQFFNFMWQHAKP